MRRYACVCICVYIYMCVWSPDISKPPSPAVSHCLPPSLHSVQHLRKTWFYHIVWGNHIIAKAPGQDVDMLVDPAGNGREDTLKYKLAYQPVQDCCGAEGAARPLKRRRFVGAADNPTFLGKVLANYKIFPKLVLNCEKAIRCVYQ